MAMGHSLVTCLAYFKKKKLPCASLLSPTSILFVLLRGPNRFLKSFCCNVNGIFGWKAADPLAWWLQNFLQPFARSRGRHPSFQVPLLFVPPRLSLDVVAPLCRTANASPILPSSSHTSQWFWRLPPAPPASASLLSKPLVS